MVAELYFKNLANWDLILQLRIIHILLFQLGHNLGKPANKDNSKLKLVNLKAPDQIFCCNHYSGKITYALLLSTHFIGVEV